MPLNSRSTSPAPEDPAGVSVPEGEDAEPQQDDLLHITELMDGFKASKVNQTHLGHSCNVETQLTHLASVTKTSQRQYLATSGCWFSEPENHYHILPLEFLTYYLPT